MRLRHLASGLLASLSVLGIVLLSLHGCGGSSLKKAYASYDGAVKPLLEREMPLWKKFSTLFNEQLREDIASPEKFKEVMQNEIVPFYASFQSDVAKLAPADPEMAEAHGLLVKYAASRAQLAQFVAANLSVLDPGAEGATLARKTNAAEQAVADYEEVVRGSAVVDPRFGLLKEMQKQFGDGCLTPMNEGKMSERDVSERVETTILPALRGLKAQKFEDDETSQLLWRAIIASEEFYAAFAKCLPLISQQSRFGDEVKRLRTAGDDQLKAFRDAMAAVRNRM